MMHRIMIFFCIQFTSIKKCSVIKLMYSNIAFLCQSVVLASYLLLLVLHKNNLTIVISSTMIVSITCVACLTMSDPDDDIRERVVETVAVEPDAIIIQIIDENIEDEIELSIIEGNATQINYDSIDPNTPQAIVVAIVIPPR